MTKMLDFQTFVRTSVAVIVCAVFATIGIVYAGSTAPNAHAASTQVSDNLNQDYFSNSNSQQHTPRQADSTSNSLNDGTYGRFLAQADTNESVDVSGNSSCNYLSDDLRIDFSNDPEQVYRLQAFLKSYNYDQLELTGEFNEQTLAAVKDFQTKHADDILEPWGYKPDEATGYVYITTRKKINEIYCDQQLSLSARQQAEISNYRNKLSRWRNQGADFDTPQYLAEYYERHGRGGAQGVVLESSEDSNDDLVQAESEGGETEQNSSESTTTSSTDVETEATSTDRSFFDRLFGLNKTDATTEPDQATTSESNESEQISSDQSESTSTETVRSEQSDSAQATTATSAAASGATTSLDQMATSVYSGINSVANFFLSPTFLLILLAVLILLLIATLLEDDADTDSFDTVGPTPDSDLDDDAITSNMTENEEGGSQEESENSDTDPFVEYDESEVSEDSTTSTQSAEFANPDSEDSQKKTETE